MKIIKEDFIDEKLCELVPETIDIILDKIFNNHLDNFDYDMIKEHLIYYKVLLEESVFYGQNN